MNDPLPNCPKCKSNKNVSFVKCRCGSCPPWICMDCLPYENAGHKGYEFFDEDEEDETQA